MHVHFIFVRAVKGIEHYIDFELKLSNIFHPFTEIIDFKCLKKGESL